MWLILTFMLVVSDLEASDDCLKWFQKSGADPKSKACEITCSAIPVDMDTFTCPSQCHQFCKKCKIDLFWSKKLSASPSPFSFLSMEEKNKVTLSLSHLPKDWKPIALKAIVKGSSGWDITSPLNAATSSEEFIILYDRAFSASEDLTRVLFHEVVHFLLEEMWSTHFRNFKREFGWSAIAKEGKYRAGDFVDIDGKLSPEEDFANSIEFFEFEPSSLRRVSPNIFRWVEKNLGQKAKLEKGCDGGQ
jgi:hypothetical protein